MVHAASGFDLAQMSYQDGNRPANTATFTGDLFGGMSAFTAIQTALIQKLRTGKGQYIDVSLLDGMLNIMVYEVQEVQAPSDEKVRVYQPLKTRDGYVVLAPTSQKNFELLAISINKKEWLNDSRFTPTRARESHWGELMSLIEEWTSIRTGLECENHLLAAGVPCSRYLTVQEAIQDPQLIARGSLTKIQDPQGSYLVPNAPFLMPGLNISPRNKVPQLNEDAHQVLSEVLNYSTKDIINCKN
jgi:crotonobetainyl-CoA:carnitine CoA-transferase CaiB-like acyl-CoA transferase